MPNVVFSREVPLAVNALYESVATSLESIAAESRSDAVALSAPAGKAGTVRVPVEVTITKRSQKDSSVALTIKARSTNALFPKFTGAIQALAMAPSRTNVRLKGTYRAPLGPIGSTINAVGLHNVAEDSLRAFFERVVDESVAAVRGESMERHRAGNSGS
jgi:hypothetical protein